MFFMFQEMELYCCKIKKFLIFSEMELCSLVTFLYFRKEISKLEKWKKKKKNAQKTFLIFSQKKPFIHFGKRNFLMFSKKVFLAFLEKELSRPKIKKEILYFRRVLAKTENQKSENQIFFVCWERVFQT